MIRCGANTMTLITDSPEPRGVFEPSDQAERTVYCTVRSVSYHERYEAAAHGLHPEYVVRLADTKEYAGETRCVIEGNEFSILHTWLHPRDGSIELTLERRGRP